MLFLDTRGSGRSSRPVDPTQISTTVMADNIDQLRNYPGLAFIRLMGHSSGGTNALDYVECFPERAEKVVLFDGAALDDPIA